MNQVRAHLDLTPLEQPERHQQTRNKKRIISQEDTVSQNFDTFQGDSAMNVR